MDNWLIDSNDDIKEFLDEVELEEQDKIKRQITNTHYPRLMKLAEYPPLSLKIHFKDFKKELQISLSKFAGKLKEDDNPFENIEKKFSTQINKSNELSLKFDDPADAIRDYIKNNKSQKLTSDDFWNGRIVEF